MKDGKNCTPMGYAELQEVNSANIRVKRRDNQVQMEAQVATVKMISRRNMTYTMA
jgi:hypothetical protein